MRVAVDVLDVWLCAHAFKGAARGSQWRGLCCRLLVASFSYSRRRAKMQICSFEVPTTVFTTDLHTLEHSSSLKLSATVSLIAEAFAWSFRQRFLPPAATIKIMAEEADDYRADDDLKVFVSRLPKAWDDETLAAHFSAVFGAVKNATVRFADGGRCCYVCGDTSHISRDCPGNSGGRAVVIGSKPKFLEAPKVSRGFGFVVFETEEGKRKALEQGSMHVLHRTIHIRELQREEENGKKTDEGGESSVGICYLWQQGLCPRGDICKFLHTGKGGCVAASAPGEGKKKCLQFRKKGRCGKGDQCPFRHIARTPVQSASVPPLLQSVAAAAEASDAYVDGGDEPAAAAAAVVPQTLPKEKAPVVGVCITWKKKRGKCRKGDKCRYLHPPLVDQAPAAVTDAKRRKIDGLALIHAKGSGGRSLKQNLPHDSR